MSEEHPNYRMAALIQFAYAGSLFARSVFWFVLAACASAYTVNLIMTKPCG